MKVHSIMYGMGVPNNFFPMTFRKEGSAQTAMQRLLNRYESDGFIVRMQDHEVPDGAKYGVAIIWEDGFVDLDGADTLVIAQGKVQSAMKCGANAAFVCRL